MQELQLVTIGYVALRTQIIPRAIPGPISTRAPDTRVASPLNSLCAQYGCTLQVANPKSNYIGSSSLIAQVLHYPPPPREQFYIRYCSNKQQHGYHTGTFRLLGGAARQWGEMSFLRGCVLVRRELEREMKR